MKLRLHQPLFGGFLAVIGVLLLGLFFFLGQSIRRQQIIAAEADLSRHLSLAEAIMTLSPGGNLDSLAVAVGRRVGHRVTLIDPEGRVLADSDVPFERLPLVENHSDRPEVVGALAGQTSFSQRTSATVRSPLLYGAQTMLVDGRPVVLRMAVSLHEIDRAVARTRWAVAGAGGIAIVVALIVSYLLSRSLARPLTVLSQRARQLTAGDMSGQFPHSRVVEMEELSSAFNRLTEQLRASVGQLARERDEIRTVLDSIEEGVVALTDDGRVLEMNHAAMRMLEVPEPVPLAPIQAMVRYHELRDLMGEAAVRVLEPREILVDGRHLMVSSRLLEAGGAVVTLLDVTEIRRMEQVRRDFVANASHELKTPLTAIRGYAESLLEADPPEDRRQEFLDSIGKNTRRLQRLVDDLLDLSRLESGGWVARTEPIDVGEVAQAVWSELAAHEPKADHVSFEIDGAAEALADEQGLEQIFRNLFENSLRYTPEGGTIRVATTRAGGDIVIEVVDTGSGIPPSALPRIFERFYRVDPARSRSEGGTGLGLAIVRHLVSAMGGTVEAQSFLGSGTTIRFTLPGA